MSGVGHPWSGQCNILLYDPEERREVPEEVPFHLRLPPPLHRHHPLLLRHLLQGATEQVEMFFFFICILMFCFSILIFRLNVQKHSAPPSAPKESVVQSSQRKEVAIHQHIFGHTYILILARTFD